MRNCSSTFKVIICRGKTFFPLGNFFFREFFPLENYPIWEFSTWGELSYWEYSHEELFINHQSYDLQVKDIFSFGEFFPLGIFPFRNFSLWGIFPFGEFSPLGNFSFWGIFPFWELSYWENSNVELFINLQSYDLQGKGMQSSLFWRCLPGSPVMITVFPHIGAAATILF